MLLVGDLFICWTNAVLLTGHLRHFQPNVPWKAVPAEAARQALAVRLFLLPRTERLGTPRPNRR